MKTKLAATGGAPAQTFVDDVFSTTLYTGNGSTQTITNGIDLAGKGGLVWTKDRVSATNTHKLTDTARGYQYAIQSSNTNAQEDNGTAGISSFGTTGYGIGSDWRWNKSADTYVSWTFRKAAKFFDVVTFTSNSLGGGTFSHSLGSAPGFIIIKSSSTQDQWTTYHRSLGPSGYMYLNTTAANNPISNFWNVSSTSVTYANDYGPPNASMVAYLFAHDTSSTGIIQCGSFTTDGSGNATVNLGWEPQYVMIKALASGTNWWIIDTMRGWSRTDFSPLYANSATNEAPFGVASIFPTATGFNTVGTVFEPSTTFIYMAIRRPNKPPTSGTQVYNAIARTGTGATAAVTGLGFTPDFVFPMGRSATSGYASVFDRLRGVNIFMDTSNAGSETTAFQSLMSFNMDGFTLGSSTTYLNTNVSARTYINWSFKRAPGFFDEVCYTGTGTGTVTHNLGVAPELIVIKNRTTAGYDWKTLTTSLTAGTLNVNTTAALNTADNPYYFGNGSSYVAPTSTVFSVYNNYNVGASGEKYVAYLFATLAGIQYINSYVGDGTTGRVINCGFSAGARFICIKATSTTGSWWVWDSARGITSGNDPALQLNSTAAEITSADAIDPSSSGFIVNQEATCSINASGVSYLVWAIA